MSKKRRKRKPSASRRGTSEWVGGRLIAPFFVAEPESHRPDLILWLELPRDAVVGYAVIDPQAPASAFGQSLYEAMASPFVGPPRKPKRVRVADARLAAEVRAVGGDIPTVVAPTPELDRIVHSMATDASLGGDVEPSYFEDGRISAAVNEALFHAAQSLFKARPWAFVQDSQVLCMDIPALGIEGACVSVIGALGECFGLVVFPSFLAFQKFLGVTEIEPNPAEPLDLAVTTLALNFDRGADLPASMRREAIAQGWPVAGPDAYPSVVHRERDGVARPLEEHDVRVATVCANSLTEFFHKHGEQLARPPAGSIAESYVHADGTEARIAYPYAAAGDGCAPVQLSGTEQNGPAGVATAAIHEVDARLIEQMVDFAGARFGETLRGAGKDFADFETAPELFFPWLAYHVLCEQKTVVQWFVAEHGDHLSNTERMWLQAQQAAWLSVWEVIEVEPGTCLVLKDLLTGEVRSAEEVAASRLLTERDALLGRVVDYQGSSLLAGIHPRPLPPRDAAEVIRRMRGRLRRKGLVPVSRLREQTMGRYLIARWEEAISDYDGRREAAPRLRNTDGDDLLVTTDHFEFDPSRNGEIQRRLATLDGVETPQRDAGAPCFLIARAGIPTNKTQGSTLLGRIWVDGGRLRSQTNSVNRADDLRARLEATCHGLIRHLAREHSDPLARLDEDHPGAGEYSSEPPFAGANEIIREFKEKHYADWVAQPLPALDGQSPRDAVKTKPGREQVDLLLKECENQEGSLPVEQRFDFSRLRRELGL